MEFPIKKYTASQIIKFLRDKKEPFWLKQREARSLALFHLTARRVPAYKDFLKKNQINPDKIVTWADFWEVPIVNKENYLRQYPLNKLCWDGLMQKPLIFASSSGSSGEPFYWMRSEKLDWEYSVMLECFIKQGSWGEQKPILALICFGLGVWVSGFITYGALEMVSRRNNYPLSILAPGLNKEAIFNALKKLSPYFKQVLIVGYPPFLKDIIDEAPGYGIDLKKINLRLLFAAEAITESFREYVAERAGIKNIYRDILNIYGSADIGAMAAESTISTLIKRLACKKKKLFHETFAPINKTPTLAQYNPLFIAFEALDREILLTGESGAMPLIRYSIGDHGGVFSFSEVVSKLQVHGLNLEKEAKKVGIEKYIYQLPFVYVYERMNMAATLYGLCIYPEWIREALLEEPICKFLTGKFTIITKYDKKHNQYLEINLELRKGRESNRLVKKQVLERIVYHLRLHSSEYIELSNRLKKHAWPKLQFWPADHPLHFQLGTKQKWVKK
jgi:phenylacetate-CoA ligase